MVKPFFGRNLGELEQLEMNKNFDPEILLLDCFLKMCVQKYMCTHTHIFVQRCSFQNHLEKLYVIKQSEIS